MANIYDKRSENHAGYNEGTKIEIIVDHHEVNRDLSSGTILTVASIAHYPTRIIAVDKNGLEWTLPIHSIRKFESEKSDNDVNHDDKENF
jgi:dihydrodipicolinate reductase